MTPATIRAHVWHGILYRRLMLLLLALLLVLSGRAYANCTDTSNPGSVTFTPPGGKIMLSNTGAAVGTVVWTSAQAIPANYPTLGCTGTTSNGIVSSYGPPTGNDETLFPTNLSWLSYRILHPDTTSPLSSYPNNSPITAGTYNFSVASALQLVITGTIPSGLQGTSPQLTIPAGKLAQWNVDMTGGTNPVEIFYVSNIQFVIPTCTTAFDPTTVTLSAVRATAFTGRGSTVGQQPFQVQLNCVAGARLRITLNATNGQNKGVIYNNNVGGATSNPGTGYARYVGVQILQEDGSTPVAFGTPITIGATQTGTMNLPFYAQYYQTSNNNVTIGDVSATATYTLSYY